MENVHKDHVKAPRRSNIIAEKSMEFAVRVVNMSRLLQERRNEHVISVQVLRSGTSIGANVHEANSAHSKADFIAKMTIALKECDETGYWLELLCRTKYLAEQEFLSLDSDRQELFALLTSIIKKARQNL